MGGYYFYYKKQKGDSSTPALVNGRQILTHLREPLQTNSKEEIIFKASKSKRHISIETLGFKENALKIKGQIQEIGSQNLKLRNVT